MLASDRGDPQRLVVLMCGLAAGFPPVGLDIGTFGVLLWLLMHSEARRRGAKLAWEDAVIIWSGAIPELGWALLAGPGVKWLNLPLGIGIGGYFNLAAARRVAISTRLYLAAGRRLRGYALRQEIEAVLSARRSRSGANTAKGRPLLTVMP